jgi:hypothetical protein
MNQPKFKFGDKVRHMRTNAKPFVVGLIRKFEDRLQYGDGGPMTDIFFEDELELYVEPKPKKLYAHREKVLLEVSFSECSDPKWGSIWERAPEYDIEYPAKDVEVNP